MSELSQKRVPTRRTIQFHIKQAVHLVDSVDDFRNNFFHILIQNILVNFS